MPALILHNSLTRRKETFVPREEGRVGMYVCGPTVYSRAHIGNARAMVAYDVLFRLFRHLYGENAVTYVRNVTDVDDKINKAAKERNIDIRTLTEETAERFDKDMEALGCLLPTHRPRATDHIAEMIAVIEKLLARKAAYAAEGHVLFSVDSYADYGNLSNRSREEMEAGARVDPAPYKKDPGDFVLWKPSATDEPGWDSPWGRGRPGWHIECTAMSGKYLGEDFDVHGGGVDLIFPHHENEKAQACAAHPGSVYARYWVHNGFLTVGGEKMSKSLGNFLTMGDILPDDAHIGEVGEAVRLTLLSAHYRKPLNWLDKTYEDCLKKIRDWRKLVDGVDAHDAPPSDKVVAALCDDLNMPIATAELNALAKAARAGSAEAQKTLKASLCLLGFAAEITENVDADPQQEEIQALVDARCAAKQNKDWAKADSIRDRLTAMGVTLRDAPGGATEWERKPA